MATKKDFSKSNNVISKLRKKYHVSKWTFLTASIILILIAAFTGLVSAYAIAKNEFGILVWMFFGISIISSISAFLATLQTVFAFQNKADKNTARIEFLDSKIADLKAGKEVNRDELVTELASIDVEE